MAVDKKGVISALEEIALLLELTGANPFKARAFQNGARALANYEGDLQAGLDGGELAKLKGIGKSLLGEIKSLLETGESPARVELRAQIPAGLLEMLKIPGLGPKRAHELHEKLGVESVGELEYACKENRLLKLPGYGEKTQAKLLKGIDYIRKFSGRHLLSDAWTRADDLVERLQQHPGVSRIELAGSIRRRKETIGDIDILVATDDPAAVSEMFVTFAEVEEIIGHGDTKSSVRLESGIQVDLRVVPEQSFPFALHYFTGSKEHNTVLRQRAKDRGLRLNEYGLFHVDDHGEAIGESVAAMDEAELFAALDLAYIEPELREDRGELLAAESGALPELLQPGDIRGALHNHSTWSDGAHSIEEMARAAQALGWEYIGLSDHSQTAFYAHGLKPDDILRQHEEIDRLNERLDGIVILKGIESDILPGGALDYDDDVLESFDFIVASVHGNFGLDRKKQTLRSVRAVQNPFTSVLGHPTGRLLLAREGFDLDMDEVIAAAGESGCAIELNANPHRLDLDWRDLPKAVKAGVKISIGADAHRTEGLKDLRYGIALARKGWLRATDVLNVLGLAELKPMLRRSGCP
jgi:DNA polymerase (family 10)